MKEKRVQECAREARTSCDLWGLGYSQQAIGARGRQCVSAGLGKETLLATASVLRKKRESFNICKCCRMLQIIKKNVENIPVSEYNNNIVI